MTEEKKEPIVIRKYANRRLYNTEISSYVTLDDLCTMVKRGEDFVVKDAKSGKDLTKSVLAQIIFEQENAGENILPTEFLKSVIGFYDDSLKRVVPVYLNMMMEAFNQNQEEMRKKMAGGIGPFNPFKQFEQSYKTVWDRQQHMFNQTLELFTSLNPMLNPNNTKDKK